MPNVDIIALERHINTGWYGDCSALAGKLKNVFVTAAGCKPESVHIRFHPVDEKYYTVGGNLLDSGDQGTPLFEINVAWYAGRTSEVQDAVAAGLTEAVSETTGLKAENVETNFRVLDPSSHYEGGKRAPSP